MITLWSLLKAGLLMLNGATILHRGRFLKKGTSAERLTPLPGTPNLYEIVIYALPAPHQWGWMLWTKALG